MAIVRDLDTDSRKYRERVRDGRNDPTLLRVGFIRGVMQKKLPLQSSHRKGG